MEGGIQSALSWNRHAVREDVLGGMAQRKQYPMTSPLLPIVRLCAGWRHKQTGRLGTAYLYVEVISGESRENRAVTDH
jgi:hypothetical protein